ncbi:unnamed protein product [Larinioides sclopetarius]|uniref:RNase H type-1 domain-containing protein n=1 Tax=Larinioides sclopetarius TaxID=280406 RepID=A0AAV2BQB2_9ARAC
MDLLKGWNIYHHQIIKFTFPQSEWPDNISFNLSNLPFQKKHLTSSEIVSFFNEFKSTISTDSIILSTDASKTKTRTTTAGINNHSEHTFSHSINSIFTAEALAILNAINYFINQRKKYLLLTDSKSVLSALRNISIKSPSIILQIQKALIQASNQAIEIMPTWTPSHHGIPENEVADKLATADIIRSSIDVISSNSLLITIKKLPMRSGRLANIAGGCQNEMRRRVIFKIKQDTKLIIHHTDEKDLEEK